MVFKTATICNEDLIGFYIFTLTSLLGTILALVHNMSPGKWGLNYYICIGHNPDLYPVQGTVFENHRKCLIQHSTFKSWVDKSSLKLPKMVNFGDLNLAVKQCYQTGSFLLDKNWWKIPKSKNENATFWVIFKHCGENWNFLKLWKYRNSNLLILLFGTLEHYDEPWVFWPPIRRNYHLRKWIIIYARVQMKLWELRNPVINVEILHHHQGPLK